MASVSSEHLGGLEFPEIQFIYKLKHGKPGYRRLLLISALHPSIRHRHQKWRCLTSIFRVLNEICQRIRVGIWETASGGLDGGAGLMTRELGTHFRHGVRPCVPDSITCCARSVRPPPNHRRTHTAGRKAIKGRRAPRTHSVCLPL